MPATFLWQHATIRSGKEMVMTAATERRAQRSQKTGRIEAVFPGNTRSIILGMANAVIRLRPLNARTVGSDAIQEADMRVELNCV